MSDAFLQVFILPPMFNTPVLPSHIAVVAGALLRCFFSSALILHCTNTFRVLRGTS